MKYQNIWSKILNDHEEVQYEFSVSKRFRKIQLIMWLIISVFFIFFPLITIIIVAVSISNFYYIEIANAYAFTSTRLLIHKGWLSTTTRSINYDKITEVTVSEPFLNRKIYHTGDLIIHTANMNDSIVFRNISDPYETKKKLDLLRHKNN